MRIGDLIDGLAPNSRYRQAVLSDPEVAAQIVDQEEADKAAGRQTDSTWRPEVRQMSPEYIGIVRLLAAVEELVSIQTGIASNGKKSRKPVGIPGPETAIDAERGRRSVEKARGILRQLVPWDYPDTTDT